jgi:hypothetical protein
MKDKTALVKITDTKKINAIRTMIEIRLQTERNKIKNQIKPLEPLLFDSDNP